MTRAQLKRSRIKWRRRRAYRRSRYLAAKRTNDALAQAKWFSLLAEADRMIERRTQQLKNADPLRVRALREAEALIGVMEQGGNNRGAKVMEIIRANGGTGPEPWCGDFVAYCYRKAGSKSVSRAWASVWWLGQLSGVARTNTPRPGDLVRFNFSHVGLYVRTVGPGVIETIEGNTGASGAVSDSATGGDGVYRKRRSTSLVQDYRRVSR